MRRQALEWAAAIVFVATAYRWLPLWVIVAFVAVFYVAMIGIMIFCKWRIHQINRDEAELLRRLWS